MEVNGSIADSATPVTPVTPTTSTNAVDGVPPEKPKRQRQRRGPYQVTRRRCQEKKNLSDGVAEVIKGASLGGVIGNKLKTRIDTGVEFSSLYYDSKDFVDVKHALVPGTKYRVLCVCKTAMQIREPANKGYAVINDRMYPNGLYYALVIRFAEEEGDAETMDMPPSKEVIVPGSIKPYGNEDVCVDLVYKCIRDVEICDLLGDWLNTTDMNNHRIPYPGQRIYLNLAASFLLYDVTTDCLVFA